MCLFADGFERVFPRHKSFLTVKMASKASALINMRASENAVQYYARVDPTTLYPKLTLIHTQHKT